MAKFKRGIMWATLIMLALLMVFSMYGAFIGAEAAHGFFNALPLTVYWIALFGLLAVGIGFFRRLLRNPGLLLIHLGCILVIIGAMWGSEGGHHFQKKFLGMDKVYSGDLIIYEGMSENRVIRDGAPIGVGMDRDGTVVLYEGHGSNAVVQDEDDRLFLLPFHITLNDFRMEYYDPPRVLVRAEGGREFVLAPIEEGTQFELDDRTTVTVLQVYKNLKIRKVEEKMEVYDYDGPGSNPAVRLLTRHGDGVEEEQYAFSGRMGQMGRGKRLSMVYQTEGMVRDYFSDLAVVEDGNVVLEKTIEVNVPLYYGGYHFYQASYDAQGGRYTVLSVTSDSGLYGVFIGYFLIVLGVVWHMWIGPALRRQDRKSASEGGRHGN